MIEEIDKVTKMAASEFKKIIQIKRLSLPENDKVDTRTTEDADYTSYIMNGVHAEPSMNHLHVHIFSVDRTGEYMKLRKHYNSFTTNFLIPVRDLPFSRDDPRKQLTHGKACIREDLKCWKCKRNFKASMIGLKEHLKAELASMVHTRK